jgi:RNA polymerase sigma-70 factor (ECF subfamily)
MGNLSDASSETATLLRAAAGGDTTSWQVVVERVEDRLRRMVSFRLNSRVYGRIDQSDVLQEIYLEAWRHLEHFLRQPELPFYLWLRGIAANKLHELHRHHLGTQMRDVAREVSLQRGAQHESTSAALAAQLLGHGTRPSEAAVRAEVKIRLHEALNNMDPIDLEVLALRHFEQLNPSETAQVLGIKEKAAGMRYVRALRRLKEILAAMPGGLSEFKP